MSGCSNIISKDTDCGVDFNTNNNRKEQLREAICKEFKRLIKKHPEDNLLKLAYKQEYINN